MTTQVGPATPPETAPDAERRRIADETAASPAVAPALGRTVGRGMVFSLGSTLFQRVASLAAQWALGLLLMPDQFGVFALATSFAMLAQVFQDAGVRWLLIQRASEWRELVGPVFWMGTAINLGLAALLAAASPLSAVIYGDQRVAWNVLVIALSIALSSPMTVLTAKLSIDLRFGRIALIQVGSAVIRYAGAVGFALAGFGALSFVLPLPLIAVFEGAAAWYSTRESPWRERAEARRWPEFLHKVKWILVVTLAAGVVNLGTYMAAGLFVTKAVLGVYYFAYMIVAQLGSALANNLHNVLFPTLQKFAEQTPRLRDAVLRAMRVLMLVAAPSCLGLAPLFRPLESLLWGGKWSGASSSVQVLAAAFPFYAVMQVVTASQVSRGMFKRCAIMLSLYGVGLVASGALGAAVYGTAPAIAAFAGVFLALGAAVYILIEVRSLEADPREVGGALLPSWVVAVGASLVTVRLESPIEGLLAHRLHGRALDLALVVAMGLVFSAVFAVGARLLVSRALRDALTVAPGKIARPAARIMLMKTR